MCMGMGMGMYMYMCMNVLQDGQPDDNSQSEIGACGDVRQGPKDQNLAVAAKKLNTCQLVLDPLHPTEHFGGRFRGRSWKLPVIRAID